MRPLRERSLFDLDWRFKLAGAELSAFGAAWSNSASFRGEGEYDDAGWQTIDLPHDFVVERHPLPENALPELGRSLSSKNGGYRPGGVGWYHKRFDVPAEDQERRTYLYFDGIYRDSHIYLNQFLVGRHLSGYTSAYFDVTDFLNYGGENLLSVRVDATQSEGW